MQTRPSPTTGRRPPRRLASALLGLLALLALRPAAAVGEEKETGEQVYRRRCASCHGASGEGVPDEYPRPLTGDRSVAQLARLIAKTMPADDPGTCTGGEAEAVASYIHGAFYSKVAQARNAPARIELARLTVKQYRNAVADLIGAFREPRSWDDRHGLRGEYFPSKRFRERDRALERIDPVVRFDFGVSSPDPEKLDPHQFSIRWTGSVLAPETGEYEFIIRSEHATHLWVNDDRKPLIDGTVSPGKDVDQVGTIYLLGGRAYPLRLEFVKAKQGVDDTKKEKARPPVPASVVLAWKRPRRVAEPIPAHCLSPGGSSEVFAVATPFPPDDRSVGYERGTSVSKAWEQATTDAAIEVANHVVARLGELSGAPADGPERKERLREFCRTFAERAFRRPLTDEQRARYVDHQFDAAPDPETAVKRVVLLALKSPRFLYREVGGDAPDAYDVASRIAFGLWDSIPDRALLDAAAAGQLSDRERVARQVERMLPDLRTRSKVRDFLLHWLKVEQAPDLAKDPEKYPGFTAEVASDLRTSLELFLDEAIWGEPSDFRRLLLAEEVYLNGRLAKFYGVDLPADAPFRKVALDPGERAGVVSHPYLLSTFAYTSTTSPIHRGVFLARGVLGRMLKPPPEAAAPLAPELHPDLTTRERVALQTKPAACVTCHGMINPLGFPLERFDAVGRYRKEERGRPIDATGSYQTRSGETVAFDGARDLATFLAGSEETHDAFVDQLFHHLVKQPVLAYGPEMHGELRRAFIANGYSIRKLIAEIATATSTLPRGPAPTRTADRGTGRP